MSVLPLLEEAARAVRAQIQGSAASSPRSAGGPEDAATPRVGVVLGSGLGAWGDTLEGLIKVPYENIPNMPRPAVLGHAGNLCFGRVDGVPVACLQGRVHLYEGHATDKAVFGVRLLAKLGCRAVLLTNAAGGINAAFSPGDLMLITDHLNLMGVNPLVGPNDPALGTRFPDMTYAHDPRLLELARAASAEAQVALQQGVYAALLGPTYETPAEIRMLRVLGADAVGMSTVPEIIALRHMGVPAAAISCVTNLAAGLTPAELNHAEVEETARQSRARFVKLLSTWVRQVGAASMDWSVKT
ncbi:purine-nucleoside phosphorylase [Chondromyces crocatus]|uniref:Purine nucleoside phosphorylase n=1 Tax=Chondromyces crocatus TaxID=52 RepID=A0A0K1EQM8_CHOCO|nr:purine-nucleoside phosphorylase [Chondromyces crocatus]AKT43141.1 purine nucleoside phosphorylase [Chondromyces crocatus]